MEKVMFSKEKVIEEADEKTDIKNDENKTEIVRKDESALELIKPGKFDIRKFHAEFEDNTEKVLLELLALQSNNNPLKKGGPGIAYRCDAIILANRQHFSIQENTLFDIISSNISSNPKNSSYTIYAKDVSQYLSYTDNSYVYKILKDATDTLSNKPLLFEITLEGGKKRVLKVPWYKILTYCGQDLADDDEGAYISFTPSDLFKMLMISSTVMHGAHYSLKASTKIQSKYVRNLYYFLETRKNYKEYQGATIGRFSISLEDLRVLVGYPESYRATDVRRYILDAAVKEINSIDEIDFTLEYELKKTQRKITGVEIQINKTTPVEEPVELEIEDISGLDEESQMVLNILKANGINEEESKRVLNKYKKNQRDIIFLTQALTAVAASKNVKSKTALLCYKMEHGIDAVQKEVSSENKFNNFNQRVYDYGELEKTLLTTEVPKE